MPLATRTSEAPSRPGLEGFNTTPNHHEGSSTAMIAHHVDIPNPQPAGRHIALGGPMPSDAVRFIEPDPVAEPGFGYSVLQPLEVNLPTLSGAVEVIRDSSSSTWEVEAVNLNTRARGMTSGEAFRLSRLLYAAGKQAQLLNEGLSPELAVLVGQSILRHPAGTR